MTESAPPPRSPIPGRGRPGVDYALQRLRESLLLRFSAVLAFMGYGGLLALVLAGRLPFHQAGVVALLSLASWFFLFWWYPVIKRTVEVLGEDARRRAVGTILEGIALGCVLLVHVLLAIIVVYAARS